MAYDRPEHFTSAPPSKVADREAELNLMVKCLKFSADLLTILVDSKEELKSIDGFTIGLSRIEWDALIKRNEILASDDRHDLFRSYMVDKIAAYDLTPCCIWEFAHLAHHCFCDVDLPMHGK